jgi:hypothetical protein
VAFFQALRAGLRSCRPYGTETFRNSIQLNPVANVPEGRCDRSLARSAWKNATPKEPSRRVRYDSCGCADRFTDLMIGVLEWRNTLVKLKKLMLQYFWSTIQFLSMANTFSCLNIHCVFSTKERVFGFES